MTEKRYPIFFVSLKLTLFPKSLILAPLYISFGLMSSIVVSLLLTNNYCCAILRSQAGNWFQRDKNLFFLKQPIKKEQPMKLFVRNGEDPVYVHWSTSQWVPHDISELNRGKIEEINKEINSRRINLEQQINAFIDLVTIWLDGNRKDKAIEIFGELFSKIGRRPLMATLTADGREFRLWHEFPLHFDYNHAESCGRGLIVSVNGHKESLRKFIDAFLGIKLSYRSWYGKFVGQDGAEIYMLRRRS
jgi:hypothetical protein